MERLVQFCDFYRRTELIIYQQIEKHMSPEHLQQNVQVILIYKEAHNKLTMLVQLDLARVMEPEVY
ncbi:hypothetical protein DKK70_09475 [Gilliamella apicola]|uniref:Uncharacterized protein n=1 Tax=Gilliamella apicola TaxID=1196095 RepID=A0A2V4E708_9GAMM|nr:hypothetical protein DKK70_09475 [Gilliamella apicola]